MANRNSKSASSLTQEIPLTIQRVALYARVSTNHGQNPEMQLFELRRGVAGRLPASMLTKVSLARRTLVRI
jgi:hypothetical protein